MMLVLYKWEAGNIDVLINERSIIIPKYKHIRLLKSNSHGKITFLCLCKCEIHKYHKYNGLKIKGKLPKIKEARVIILCM